MLRAVVQTRVVAVAEIEQDAFGRGAAAATGCAKAARSHPGGGFERVGRASREIGFGGGIERVPGLVQPAVHAELVAARGDLAHGVRMLHAVPTFDEEGRAQRAALEQREERRVADGERRVLARGQRAGAAARRRSRRPLPDCRS